MRCRRRRLADIDRRLRGRRRPKRGRPRRKHSRFFFSWRCPASTASSASHARHRPCKSPRQVQATHLKVIRSTALAPATRGRRPSRLADRSAVPPRRPPTLGKENRRRSPRTTALRRRPQWRPRRCRGISANWLRTRQWTGTSLALTAGDEGQIGFRAGSGQPAGRIDAADRGRSFSVRQRASRPSRHGRRPRLQYRRQHAGYFPS